MWRRTAAGDSVDRLRLPLRWRLFAAVAALLDILGGLIILVPSIVHGLGRADRWDTPRRRRRGMIIVLGGIEGPSLYARAMAVGILRTRWRGAVMVYPWNRGVPLLRSLNNLMNTVHQERQVRAIARFIAEQRAAHPDARVAILAQSGGCWIALRAMESLDGYVDAAVLLAPAVSPLRDVSRAASHCRESLISIGAAGDLVFLGFGTLLLGTSDRHHVPAAGLLGWQRRAAKFRDIRWRPEWLAHGYIGNHISTCSPRFIERVVAPWLTGGDGAGRRTHAT